MRLPPFVELCWEAIKGWQADHAPRLGAALAFYTLFAIAPVLLVSIAIAGSLFGEAAVRGEIVNQIDGVVGTEGALAVQRLLEGASRPRESRIASMVGAGTLLLAATGVFMELQAAFNKIWRVKPKTRKRGLNVRRLIFRRIRSFGLIVSIGFVMIVSLAVSAALAALGDWLGRQATVLPALLDGVNAVVSLAVTTFLFGMMYRVLPDVRLRWRDVAVGALVTALMFMIGKTLIGAYIARSQFVSGYGAVGSVLVLLTWVYYSSQILLLGAEFTRAYTARDPVAPEPEDIAEEDPDAARQIV